MPVRMGMRKEVQTKPQKQLTGFVKIMHVCIYKHTYMWIYIYIHTYIVLCFIKLYVHACVS